MEDGGGKGCTKSESKSVKNYKEREERMNYSGNCEGGQQGLEITPGADAHIQVVEHL